MMGNVSSTLGATAVRSGKSLASAALRTHYAAPVLTRQSNQSPLTPQWWQTHWQWQGQTWGETHMCGETHLSADSHLSRAQRRVYHPALSRETQPYHRFMVLSELEHTASTFEVSSPKEAFLNAVVEIARDPNVIQAVNESHHMKHLLAVAAAAQNADVHDAHRKNADTCTSANAISARSMSTPNTPPRVMVDDEEDHEDFVDFCPRCLSVLEKHEHQQSQGDIGVPGNSNSNSNAVQNHQNNAASSVLYSMADATAMGISSMVRSFAVVAVISQGLIDALYQSTLAIMHTMQPSEIDHDASSIHTLNDSSSGVFDALIGRLYRMIRSIMSMFHRAVVFFTLSFERLLAPSL